MSSGAEVPRSHNDNEPADIDQSGRLVNWGKNMPESQKEAYARLPDAEADAGEFIDLLGRDSPAGKAFAEDFARVLAKVKAEPATTEPEAETQPQKTSG